MLYTEGKRSAPGKSGPERGGIILMEMKFYRCEVCGQIVAIVKKTGSPVVCCGKPMKELIPGTTDASVEKHVPVFEVKDGFLHVSVGSVPHPMAEEHYIEWVSVQTKFGNQRKARAARATRSRRSTPTATCTGCGRAERAGPMTEEKERNFVPLLFLLCFAIPVTPAPRTSPRTPRSARRE